jgi:hypothetical protein
VIKDLSWIMSVPSKSRIVEYWRSGDRLYEELGILVDWGEPQCWACGQWWWGRYDMDDSTPIPRRWERPPLQRCHVIPRSLGGSDEPSNLVLMCSECHDLSPDVSDRGFFVRWMQAQCWYQREVYKIREAIRSFGHDPDDTHLLEKLAVLPRSDAFRTWASPRIGLHGRQGPPFGVGFSISTLVAAKLMYLAEQPAISGPPSLHAR